MCGKFHCTPHEETSSKRKQPIQDCYVMGTEFRSNQAILQELKYPFDPPRLVPHLESSTTKVVKIKFHRSTDITPPKGEAFFPTTACAIPASQEPYVKNPLGPHPSCTPHTFLQWISHTMGDAACRPAAAGSRAPQPLVLAHGPSQTNNHQGWEGGAKHKQCSAAPLTSTTTALAAEQLCKQGCGTRGLMLCNELHEVQPSRATP